MKKYLILTITSGNGHNSAANAVKEALEKRGAGAKVVDVLKELLGHKTLTWVYEKGYAHLCQHLQCAYNAYFRHYLKADPKNWKKAPIFSGVGNVFGKLLQLVYEYQPDAIYSTHYLPAALVSVLKQNYFIPAKSFAFVFDFTVCPFWECATKNDYILVPNASFVPKLEQKGYQKSQILPLGLTVREDFSVELNKSKVLKSMGLEENVFTIMVMYGGGFWRGNYEIVKNIIKNIKHKIQIIVVNGKDKKSFARIEKLKLPENIKLVNIGYSNNVDVQMSAADVMVGKAGGVSVSETLNKRLPLICCGKLPQQEKNNIEMLKQEGASKQFVCKKQLIEILNNLIENPQELQTMQSNIDRIRKPFATRDLALLMLNSCADYSNTKPVDCKQVNKKIKQFLKQKEK